MSEVHVRLRVGSEQYAFPVENVREVVALGDVAALPGASASVLGIRNLRGRVLPVYDLATVLGIASEGAPARLLVAEESGRLAGLAVDDVSDVAELTGTIEPTESRFLSGASLASDGLVGIVDVASLFEALEGGAAA